MLPTTRLAWDFFITPKNCQGNAAFQINEQYNSSHLRSDVWGALVNDDLVNFAELSKILVTSENLSITESRGKPDNKDEVFLYNSTQQGRNHCNQCWKTVNFSILTITCDFYMPVIIFTSSSGAAMTQQLLQTDCCSGNYILTERQILGNIST